MPEGWRLVPVEPTPKQIGDGIRALMDAPDLGGIVEPYLPEVVDAYKAMLTSAPPAPPAPSVGGQDHIADASKMVADTTRPDGVAKVVKPTIGSNIAWLKKTPPVGTLLYASPPPTDAARASGDEPLTEFQEGQWWIEELDAMVKDAGTDDQKRAVAVVHHLLRASSAAAAKPDAARVEADRRDAEPTHWIVMAPCGEGVVFDEESAAKWALIGGDRSILHSTLAQEFRDCYDEGLRLIPISLPPHGAALAAERKEQA